MWPSDLIGTLGSRVGCQAGTIRTSLDNVAKAFRTNQLGSPVHDARGRAIQHHSGRPADGLQHQGSGNKTVAGCPSSGGCDHGVG